MRVRKGKTKKQQIFYLVLWLIVFAFMLYMQLSYEPEPIVEDNGYIINSYDVDIVVNENNTYDVTETINPFFIEPRRGIYRFIPLKNHVKRLDGSESINRAKITNIQTSDKYYNEISHNYFNMRFGKVDTYVDNPKTYTIKYNYDIGKDPNKGFDEFYFNIIGTEWNTRINDVTFKIHFPSKIDIYKLGFSVGNYGSDSSKYVYYGKDGNTIIGKLGRSLNPGEGLTVRTELPENYFENEGDPITILDFIYFGLPIFGAILCVYLWIKYGNDKKVVEVIEFYPPENLNSLELSCLYKGEAFEEDITSLLICLANKGYLKIEEKEDKSFDIIKIKDYDGNNKFERMFFEGIFKDYLPVNGEVRVEEKDLRNKFYEVIKDIDSTTDKYIEEKGVFIKRTLKQKVSLIALFIVSLILMFAIPAYRYGAFEMLFNSDIIDDSYVKNLGVSIFSIIIVAIVYISTRDKKAIPGCIIFLTISSLSFIAGYAGEQIMFYSTRYVIGTIINAICLVTMAICIKYMRKRTEYGNELLGKMEGFKTFLKTVEKDKLETLIYDNPTYFYDILPYVYVFGITKVWMKKFEGLIVPPPSWYIGNSLNGEENFMEFMMYSSASLSETMVSSPRRSGRGSSGGGFAGGGSGGGGGGSW